MCPTLFDFGIWCFFHFLYLKKQLQNNVTIAGIRQAGSGFVGTRPIKLLHLFFFSLLAMQKIKTNPNY